MAKATTKTTKGKDAPAAVKAKGAQVAAEVEKSAEAKARDERLHNAIVRPSPKAMQVALGREAVIILATGDRDEEESQRLKHVAQQSHSQGIMKLTMAVYKAAMADTKNIDLTAQFSEDSKAKGRMKETVLLALGIKSIRVTEKGHETTQWAPELKELLPQPGETKNNSDTFQRRDTFRSNLERQISKAIGSALFLQREGVKAKEAQTDRGAVLQIEGPAVKKMFGQPSVAIDEKIKVMDGEKEVTLKQKPSFTALYDNAAKALGGHTMGGKSNTRGLATGGTNKTPAQIISDAVPHLISALDKLTDKDWTDSLVKVLAELRDKIEATGHVA